MNAIPNARRRLLKIALLGAAAAPMMGHMLARPALANLPPLGEADPTGMALGFREDTTKVEASKYPNHRPDQTCANCNLAQTAQADGRLPCSIFPGKSVGAKGWCAAWVKKP